MGVSPGVPSGEPIKKKRGRPRKYGPDGPVSLQLSPMSAAPNVTPGSNSSSQKRARGRPPGTGRKQILADLGEWMNNSAGMAFAPHVITIGVGEISELSLVGFVVGCPFDRRRSTPDNVELLLKPLNLHPVQSKTIIDKFAAVGILQGYTWIMLAGR
ncbi:hypothetical protein ACJW30_03G044500 [Castanea mollissima]